jgi:hypothetical protein
MFMATDSNSLAVRLEEGKTLRLPGFTAQATLGPATQHYNGQTYYGTPNTGRVISQLMVAGEGYTRVFRSPDGRLILVCVYDDVTGELIYCDIL